MVIGLSGKVGSGKSSLAKALVDKTGHSHVSFGDFVRKQAKDEGQDPSSREVLQQIGEKFINKDIEKFCIDVLGQIDWKSQNIFIVEGIRHLEVLKTLKRILKSHDVVLIYLEIDENERKKRLNLTDKDLNKIDSHSTEIQLDDILKSEADLVINGNLELATIVNKIIHRFPALRG